MMHEKRDFAEMSENTARGGNGLAPVESAESNNPEHQLGLKSTYIDEGELSHLTQEHRDYLLARHGTLALDPIPSDDPADPYNWPAWKKNVNLVLVAFHAFMCTFTAASIIPAFEPLSEALHTTIPRTSYLVSMQIAVLGFAPLFWKPISYRFGRRPVWLISTLLSCVLNIGCAVSTSYGTLSLCRCLVSFFISPASAIGTGVVVETFFKKDRGQKAGIWTALATLGPPTGPFVMGFVTYHVGFKWIFWILAIINGVQFILYIFFGPETRFIRRGVEHRGKSAFKEEYLNFGRLDPSPIRPVEFIAPAFLAKYTSILIPAVSYALVFNFASVFLTVEIPQIFIPKFGFNPQQLGLQFLGIMIGTVIGELLAGPLSDWWMKRGSKKVGDQLVRPKPEHRLWMSYLGFLLSIVGLIVFGIQTLHAKQMHWNVTPIIGIGIAAAGNQIVTTVLISYALESHPEASSSIGTFVNLVRQTWAFIGPFYFPDMLTSLNVAGACGLMAGLLAIFAVVPIVVIQFLGGRWRESRTNKDNMRGPTGRGD